MTMPAVKTTSSPSILEHDLKKYFPDLLIFESTRELEASPLYKKIKAEVDRILNAIVSEPPASVRGKNSSTLNRAARNHAGANGSHTPEVLDLTLGSLLPAYAGGSDISALAWNLERGIRFQGIVEALKTNPRLRDRDILLLTELDYGMARSDNRFVARELARELNLYYAFAPVYIALQKGSGVEADIEGENTNSLHGLAMFSRYPMRNIHAVSLPNGKDKMWGKEKRIGHLRALIAEIEHPAGELRAVTIHLDAHCSRAHRHRQMKIILDHLETLRPMPTLLGGDWNTTTFNSQNATRAILGYWRRVFMGPKNVARNHLPHPERYFERRLFGDLERRGYQYEPFNQVGTGTLHYHIESIEKNTNLRDWVPEWCFPFIFWAAGRVGGKVSGRLDWFAGRGVKPTSAPDTVQDLLDDHNLPLSDHDAIAINFALDR